MDYGACGEFNAEDILQIMTETDFSHEQIKALVRILGLGEYLPEFSSMTAERMIFIHSNGDYNFAAKELNWLTFASEVLKGKTTEGINIFSFNMSCSFGEYYVPSAALIKIFNVAFPEDSLFVFKVGSKFAIGCKRTFSNEIPNNFCIGPLLGEDTLDKIETLIDEFAYVTGIRDYPPVILAFSPQEHMYQQSIDQSEFTPDYLLALDEIQSMYGVDASLEKERYIDSFSNTSDQSISYRAACAILHDVGEGEGLSSLDFLDAAEAAEETWKQRMMAVDEVDSGERDAENAVTHFSEEAYLNAEVMLTEMLKQSQKSQGHLPEDQRREKG